MRYWTARRDCNQENMSSNENALVYTGSELSSLSCTTVNDIPLVFAAGPPPEYNSHQYHHHHQQQYYYNILIITTDTSKRFAASSIWPVL